MDSGIHYISYYGQTRTCNKCGDPDHASHECTVCQSTQPQDRQNAIHVTDDEYPTLPKDVNDFIHEQRLLNENVNTPSCPKISTAVNEPAETASEGFSL